MAKIWPMGSPSFEEQWPSLALQETKTRQLEERDWIMMSLELVLTHNFKDHISMAAASLDGS